MKLGIRTKIILITTGIMFIAILASIMASSHHFSQDYAQALQTRAIAIGKSLKFKIDRLLQLGMQVENITGFDEQCLNVVNKYEGIHRAMVVDLEGRILFHNNASLSGSSLKDTALLKGSKSNIDIVVRSSINDEAKEYSAFIPIFNEQGRHVASAVVGFPAEIIKTKTREATVFSIKFGMVFLTAAVGTLLALLSIQVTRPLTRLLTVIHEMRDKGKVITRKVAIGNTRDELGQVAMAFNMMTEILQKTTVSRQVLEYQATHDALTGLPNRSLLADRLERVILTARRNKIKAAVLFVDLDNFKNINDTLGHDTGDQVLRSIAQRLVHCVRSSDTVSRQAGDEFVIVVQDLSEAENAAEVAKKVIKTVSEPLALDHELTITCSIGISVYPKDGEDVPELLKNADAALYRAKEQGKNSFQFFTAGMNAKLKQRMLMERELRLALEREEFALFYQPKVSLHSGRIVGMESLIRWQHPQRGIVGPGAFIATAEETGLIEPIGNWVLRTACRQVKAWQEAGLPKLPVAVNVSVRQFRNNSLVQTVKHALDESSIDPGLLELEVTESLLMLNTDKVQSVFKELKGIGVGLAMDDFGTGYSSLSYLNRFPFDKLKLDIAFVRDITRNPESAAIALAVIAMAHALGLKVVAEGVESESQMNYLRQHGCDQIQGYFFSRPLPKDEFESLLLEDRHLDLPTRSNQEANNTILLVDDDAHVLSSLQRVLKRDNYCILTASNAEEAFELLASNRVGVIVADHCMPDITGVELLSRVRRLHPSCIRIAITGKPDLRVVTEAVNRGAVFKFMTKPWRDDQLRETIHEAFTHYIR